MDFRLKLHCSVVSFMLLLPALCFAGNDAYISTRATYYGSPDCFGTASKYIHIYTHMCIYHLLFTFTHNLTVCMHACTIYVICIYFIFIISNGLCQVELVDMENMEELLIMAK